MGTGESHGHVTVGHGTVGYGTGGYVGRVAAWQGPAQHVLGV